MKDRDVLLSILCCIHRIPTTHSILCSSFFLIQLNSDYFWKWTPVPGMVQVERGSNVVKGNMASSLEGGDRIRIGHEFETEVVVDDDMEIDDADDSTFKIKDGWKLDSACKYT